MKKSELVLFYLCQGGKSVEEIMKNKNEKRKSTYIGVEMVEAEPQSRAGIPGYIVSYPESEPLGWIPKDIFDSRYFRISQSDKLTEPDIKNFLHSGFMQVEKRGEKSTLVEVEMPTGWKDYEISSCIDPKNYDQELGKKYALENIEHRLWRSLGFVLQWAVNGLKRKS